MNTNFTYAGRDTSPIIVSDETVSGKLLAWAFESSGLDGFVFKMFAHSERECREFMRATGRNANSRLISVEEI